MAFLKQPENLSLAGELTKLSGPLLTTIGWRQTELEIGIGSVANASHKFHGTKVAQNTFA